MTCASQVGFGLNVTLAVRSVEAYEKLHTLLTPVFYGGGFTVRIHAPTRILGSHHATRPKRGLRRHAAVSRSVSESETCERAALILCNLTPRRITS